jgi:hypothetical protein
MALAAAGGGLAEASIVTGQITGAPIPAPGAGAAFVRAVSLETGEVIAVDDADTAGRYRLTVPKGSFALLPTVITIGKLYSPRPTRVRLKRGQRTSVRLPARAKATNLRPIVAMPDDSFTGATGDFSVLHRGLRDMLIRELLLADIPGCDITAVERGATGFGAILQEHALARRGVLDPATAPRLGRLITPTRGIRGTITVANGRMRIDAQIYQWSSKKTLHATSVEGAQEEFFQLEPDLVRRLAALLCEKPPPISGTFTGSLDMSRLVPVGAVPGKIDWNGSVELEPQAPLTPGLPPQFSLGTTYQSKAGTVTVRINKPASAGNCGIVGEGTFDIVGILGGAVVPVLTITDGDPDTYRLTLDGGILQIPSVKTDCPPDQAASNGSPAPWPLRGIGLLPFSQTPAVTSDGVFSGSTTGTQPGVDDGYQWTWSLRG